MNEHVFRDILVTLSSYSIGTALFAAALCVRMLKANRRRYLSFAAAKVGYALSVGTVLLRIIIPNPTVAFDGWGAAYTAGLTIAGLGFMGAGRAIRRDFVEWESEQLEAQRQADNGAGAEE